MVFILVPYLRLADAPDGITEALAGLLRSQFDPSLLEPWYMPECSATLADLLIDDLNEG